MIFYGVCIRRMNDGEKENLGEKRCRQHHLG